LGDNTYNQKTIASMEIALAALAAVPVGYINRHTGVFHKPEWMMGDDSGRALLRCRCTSITGWVRMTIKSQMGQ
jgi:hypothetical protein